MNYYNKLIEVLKSKQAKRFYWNTLNGAIGIAIVYFTEIDVVYAPLIIAALNYATKEINNKLSN
jgi:hypothetical protein